MCTRESRRRLAAWIAGCAFLCLLGSPRIAAQVGGAIEGQIATIDNLPVPPDVTVRLEAAEGTYVDQSFVGTDGKFVFANVAHGLYRLVITARGYRTATQNVDMSWLASRIVKIFLVPEIKKVVTALNSSAVSATDAAASKTARAEFEKGLKDLENGNLGGSRKHLLKAIAEHPCYARAHTLLGIALSMDRQLDNAGTAFRRSIECDAGFVEAYVQYAGVLNVQSRYPDCESVVEKGLGHFPGEWRLHYQRGIARVGAGDFPAAKQALLRAQTIHPEIPPEFHLRLADVYLALKKYGEAYTEMAEYLRMDPKGTYAKPTRMFMKHLETSGMVPASAPRQNSKSSNFSG